MENSQSVNLYLGNTKNKEYLIHSHIYEYVKNKKIKFGTVIGNAYPYYKYFSDNIYIKYDEEILNDYLNNMNNIYFSTNEKIDNNILIVDSNKIYLNTDFWKFFLENYKNYNTTIFIVTDKINNINIDNIKKYVDNTYIVRYTDDNFKNMYKIYKTFFQDNIEYLNCSEEICKDCDKYDLDVKYIKIICENLTFNIDVICINKYLNNIKIYKGIITTNTPLYNFNTYKIYDEYKKINERCTLRNIINV
jgi:hypothetical protein